MYRSLYLSRTWQFLTQASRFDLFLTPSYPRDPPKLYFTLEKADEDGMPMNPNLHAGSGTVCLSLLNTWSGDPSQMWQPNKSTILSVLVSVQAFILGSSNPYENEPGRHGSGLSAAAIKHNKQIENKVLTRAITPWVEKINNNAPDSSSLWGDISYKYWEYNRIQVVKSVKALEGPNKPLRAKRRLLEIALRKAFGSGNKRKRDTNDINGKELEDAIPWEYGGPSTMKSIREACSDFGVKSARSMKESLERLEKEVNENELGNSELGKKWGVSDEKVEE